jgi:NADH-quinone oxidoreductase subunit G
VATIYIDNKAYEADSKRNLLDVCLALGLNLPYFCWHPALGSVGACRQCAVKQYHDEKDKQGRLVMACLTAVTDKARISIEDPEAAAFRSGVIEGLMTSHPHDCPVCDEGGECHLQDMTVMTGHDYRKFEFEKRTFRNQNLGPLVNQEMNRCIQCYRCVRFYNEYAGGHDFGAFSLRNQVFFGRHADGVLENEFSGNLVEVCPTGVFTDKTLKRHYTRKWDLQMAPSVCVHCGLGCNTTVGERYGTVRRILNRYNGEVNGYFLCDRGRFGYEFVNSSKRIKKSFETTDAISKSISRQEALDRFAGILCGNRSVIGIGSPRASLEANFALRTLVGPGRFFAGVSDEQFNLFSIMLEILRTTPARTPSLREIELSDAVLVLGEDVTNVAPRMALSLRQSVRQQPMQSAEKAKIPLWHEHAVQELLQNEKGPMFVATAAKTALDDVATRCYRGAPDDIARLGFAVAHALDEKAPEVRDLPTNVKELAEQIAHALKTAKRSLIVSGPSCNNVAVIQAAANVARAVCEADLPALLAFTTPECNSLGLALLGSAPLGQALEEMKRKPNDLVIILENDLYQRIPQRQADAFLNAAKEIVVLDHMVHATAKKATLTLAAGTFAESEGTFVSNEGRAQRYYRVLPPEEEMRSSWEWLHDVTALNGRKEEWHNFDDLASAMAAEVPALATVAHVSPNASFRMNGEKIAREPYRSSGRTAILANISVHEPRPPEDPNSSLSFSMEGTHRMPPAALNPFYWSPGWNSIQATNFYQQEIAGPLRGGDPGIRLIEPEKEPSGQYFDQIPPAFRRSAGNWLLVPLYHIFGSEELSVAAPGIAELAQTLYVAINTDDAERLHVAAGDEIAVTLDGAVRHLPIVIKPELPPGVAGVPAGLPGLSTTTLPVRSVLDPTNKPTHV